MKIYCVESQRYSSVKKSGWRFVIGSVFKTSPWVTSHANAAATRAVGWRLLSCFLPFLPFQTFTCTPSQAAQLLSPSSLSPPLFDQRPFQASPCRILQAKLDRSSEGAETPLQSRRQTQALFAIRKHDTHITALTLTAQGKTVPASASCAKNSSPPAVGSCTRSSFGHTLATIVSTANV